MKLFSGRKILILLSPGFVFWTESLTCLAFLMPVQRVVAQLSLLKKIVDVGSMKPDLHKLAIKIFGACLRSKIKLEIQWIPRPENEKADFISRLIDVDDWQLTESFFPTLEGAWGPHSVDCMATFYNAKVLLEILESWKCRC